MLYLFAYRAVVVGVQNFDFHNSLCSEDTITGSNVKKIIVFLFTVQRLSDRDLPFVLNVLDCKLAERVPSLKRKCMKWVINSVAKVKRKAIWFATSNVFKYGLRHLKMS